MSDKRKSLQLKVDDEMWKAIKILSIETNIPIYTIVTQWVKEKLNEKAGGK